MWSPISRYRDKLAYHVERFFVRGPQYQVLAVIFLIGIISVSGGALVYQTDFGGALSDATWWAFLRLSDPGYLGDDNGIWRRAVSTVLTVLGYVVFLGALVAIMTQWLTTRMKDLEAGVTPVARSGHIVVLGWTNRTATIVRDFLFSEGRVRRFLRLHRTRNLKMVVLVNDLDSTLVQDLKDRVGNRYSDSKVVLRSGNSLRREHLARADVAHAAAVVIPAADMGNGQAELADTRTIKTLLTMSSQAGDDAALPLVIAEIVDPERTEIAKQAYRGDIEIVDSASIVSRLISQHLRHPGMSVVHNHLLAHEGENDFYLRAFPELAGQTYAAVSGRFSAAIPIGFLRPSKTQLLPLLNPPAGTMLEADDHVVFVAPSLSQCIVGDGEPFQIDHHQPVPKGMSTEQPPIRHVLILGWSHKVPVLVRELITYTDENLEITIGSVLSCAERAAQLGPILSELDSAKVRQVLCDYAIPAELSALNVRRFQNILIMGSDRLPTGVDSDARTLVGLLGLNRILQSNSGNATPHILPEILDPENVELVEAHTDEFLVTPLVLSHFLSQITLRRSLQVVFAELFTAGGAELVFRETTTLNAPASHLFRDWRRVTLQAGDTLLGFITDGNVHLNPDELTVLQPGVHRKLIVVTTFESGGS